jgi:photosystem II stability/assembly factor-like uncharacterized protein
MANAPVINSTRRQLRTYLQLGGPGPDNPLKFWGVDMAQIEVTGVTRPIVGKVDPISNFSPNSAQEYVQNGQMIGAPAFGTATITFREVQGGGIPLPWILGQCPLNLYEVEGPCNDLSDFLNAWTGAYVTIYSLGTIMKADPKDRTSFETDAPIEYSVEATWTGGVYATGALNFGPQSVSLTSQQVVDVVYGSHRLCADCGQADDGTRTAYALLNPGGTYTKPQVAYTIDGGQTWTKVDISAAAVAEAVAAIDIVGNKLVVVSRTASSATVGGYYYATIGSTGVPGTFTKITNGFVANKNPNDIFVKSNSEIWFVGDGGYIYKSTDITSGVSVNNAGGVTTNNLLRIHGDGTQTLVAVGASSTLIKTANGGTSWAATTVVPVTGISQIQAVWVLDTKKYWIGTNFGEIWYTRDGGESWLEKTIPGQDPSASSGEIKDIIFATQEIGYFIYNSTTPTGQIFGTFDGGRSFTNTGPRISGLGSPYTLNRLSSPQVSNKTLAGIYLLAGGLNTSANGTLLLGSSVVS